MKAVLLMLTMCLLVLPANAKYSGGTGEPNDPYQIATAADLMALGEDPNDYDKHFILTADIDLDPSLPGRKVFDKAVIDSFSGVFDGNGHTISHLTIRGAACLGLFGWLQSGATVRDLGLVAVKMTGSDWFVGALAGSSKANVTRCYGSGFVSGKGGTGGLIGESGGNITQCYSTCALSGNSHVGGLVGYNHGTVTQCYSTGAVSCTGQFAEVGGLVGQNDGDVTHCYSTGAVNGNSEVGGLVGRTSSGTVTGCFWDTQTSRQAKSAGGTGLTTAQMQIARAFICWASDGVWTIDEGKDYPRLRWENAPGEPITRDYHYGGGNGTQLDPYLIYTAEHLDMIGLIECDLDKHFKLMEDIDLSAFDGKDARPAFNILGTTYDTAFTGVFDGNGHTISHLTVTGKNYVGLFGCVGSGGEVKDLGVVDVNISGSGNCVGGLVGRNDGTVTACYSTGTVSGGVFVGGLVGRNDGTVTACYSTGAVSGTGQYGGVGGLVGWNESSVTQCYSTGAVSGTGQSGSVGGLVGSGGDYSHLTACFWDTQTSGRSTSSGGGTGLTTAQMQRASTFLGWGGCGALWTIVEGEDYPHLAWENMPGQFLAAPTYGGGSGTVEEPYLIYTAEELDTVGRSVCDWDKYFKLMADIDLSAFDAKDARPAFNIIGTTYDTAFTGVFDGNGHTISHLTVTVKNYVGLFGRVGSGGEVKDLGVVDVNISGSGDCVGGLVGENDGTVTACYSTGTVSGGVFVGGLVGGNDGTVTQCYSTSSISGDDSVGGLVGSNYEATVTHCYSTGAVSGTSSVGGLVGSDYSGIIVHSVWDMQTSHRTTSAGGIGLITSEMQRVATFLVWGTCGNEGVWTIDEGIDYPRLWWEGQPGEVISNPPLSHFLTGTGTDDDPLLVYTAEQLYMIGLFPCEWDKHFKLMADIDLSGFDGKDGRPAFNIIGQGEDKPRKGGVIVRGVPFVGVFDGNGHTIVNFTHASADTANIYIGLFGYVDDPNAQIKDLGLIDPNVTRGSVPNGTLAGVGCLVGRLDGGTITGCYVQGGSVKGEYSVGGLVGRLDGGTITGCYVQGGSVKGEYSVGGLVGRNGGCYYPGWCEGGTILNSHTAVSVSGDDSVGGLVGSNGGSVIQCYSTGVVSGSDQSMWVGGLVGYNERTVTASFWDTQTSGRPTSSGGVGQTTAEMQDPNTFMAAGWDLVGQADGPHDIWAMPEGGGYPILWWQLSPLPSLPRFSGGTGEPNDPYLISTAEALNSIGHNPRLMGVHFELVNDIDLAGIDFYIIGSEFYPFTGSFNGNGHTVAHLTIEGESYVGLFGYLGSGAEVRDLGVVDVHVTGSGDCVGGLVGSNYEATVTHCYSTGAVSGASYVGGLVGANGTWSTQGGIVTNCYSTGMVSGQSGVGGLVGDNFGQVTQCYSTGAVMGTGDCVGGLVGLNEDTVTQCYSTGSVSGNDYIGGLVGSNGGSVTNCYSTGAVSGQSAVGGLVGYYGGGSIIQCYAAGAVSGPAGPVGGLVGSEWAGSSVTDCFWDTQTSGQTKSSGGTGKTTAEMQKAKTFLEAGWDFVGETVNGTEDIWWIDEGKDYPRLWWETAKP